VLAAHAVASVVDNRDGATPTPVISHAILSQSFGEQRGRAEGIVVTPSHNPPDGGGFRYSPPHGGAADTDATGCPLWSTSRASGNASIRVGDDPLGGASLAYWEAIAERHRLDITASAAPRRRP
jgi:phosphoglucomutase